MSESSTPKHRLGPQRNPEIDAAVLAATRALLIENGYAGVSIDAIAKRANVGRPTIYRRWPSKAHIVHEAVYPVLDFESAPDFELDGTVAEDVTRLIEGAVALFGDPATRAAAPGLMYESRTDDDLRKVLVTDQLERIRAALALRIQQATDSGELRAGVDADAVLDIVAGASIFALSVRDVADSQRLAASLVDVVLHGILAPDP
ncbi:TetR/AcrR family transcriptional regulator [Antrihabitans cavernicola]|uniref:TetR/AcrR family transcriptional regulator n=1 Tax=Antrihabitans cavernicola TaxID=2495913 RepID=A0A5A7SFI2_9NOCA|nr:TetR/AcrR family transcriptional regulator [Spelaeibacter cavernicola]KAA0024199.1 TetR/AcrR family transcriptional regulator [Spelaeibacter cavernicola]